MSDKETKKGNGPKIVISTKLIIVIAIIAAACLGVGFGVSSVFSSSQKVTDLGFKDIGELATQEADVTIVKTQSQSQKINGIEIPFTESKNIFSYDMCVKAGIDFGEVEVIPNDTDKTVVVKIPEIKVLSNEVKQDSFQLYDEKQGLFTKITLTDTNNGIQEMKDEAVEKAEANGLYDKARANVETMMKSFLASSYDWDVYTLTFEDK